MKGGIPVAFAFFALVLLYGRGVFAQNPEAEVRALQETVTEKKSELTEIEKRVKEMEAQIASLQKKARTLETQTAVLENRISKTELDIQYTELQSATVLDELAILEKQVAALEQDAAQKRAGLQEVLREINRSDEQGTIFVLFGKKTFSEFFEEVRAMERLNRRLQGALTGVRSAQQSLLANRKQKEEKLTRLDELKTQLADEQNRLEGEQSAKVDLLVATRESEEDYQELVRDLEAEQSRIEREVLALQDDISARLKGADGEGVLTAFSWPFDGYSRLTTLFHDPTYPFRGLFEHSGLDIPAPVGTAVRATAPGYVAYTRQGRLYGNYLMIIHADGFATLYAHLSGFTVQPDQFVSRGEVVARSGGARGAKGSGLSTGPHLHFEIRKNGIPTDPLNYVSRP